tara:strand:- start:3779 stop:4072 length:294 start_codon:yes stop_codon:yes gene_type:complete
MYLLILVTHECTQLTLTNTRLVGSIQLTNDLDVHVALLQAPSYQKQMDEKYFDQQRTTAQVCRQYVDLFGIMQKVPNALGKSLHLHTPALAHLQNPN